MVTPWIPAKIIGEALPDKDQHQFLKWLGLLLGLQIMIAVLSLWHGHIMRKIGGRVVFDLRRRMYRHLHRLSLGFFEARGSGEIIARMMNDVAAITTLVTGTAMNTIVSVCKAVGILAVLFFFSWKIALLALAVMPLHFLEYFLFRRRLSHLSWNVSEKTSQIYGKASEVFGAAKMVKAYSRESRELRTLVSQFREKYELEVRAGFLSSIWGWSAESISNIGNVVVMLVCGIAVILGGGLGIDGVTKYIVVISYVGMLYAPISQLIAVANQLIPAKVGMQRVFEILDMEPDVVDAPSPLSTPLRGGVQFDGVGFAYPTSKKVLNDISFSASTGEVVALVGPSGSGKTTIAGLIARLYDCTEGEVLLDGVDIRNFGLASLRNQMSVVLQETFLFRGTIRENLRYGKPEATQEEIEQAARSANAHEFIQTMPNGYDTIVGSHGARLSGGQRQRLAIARALIREPKILILDEATSSLDAVSEAKVQEALVALMEDRTTFIIAHRLSTVRNADKILVLNEGQIVQAGTHEQLIGEAGLYRELYDPDWAKEKEEREERELQRLAAVA
jgi:ABC-type multidrug transport system fused ATPase/permease subunit